MIVNLVTQQCDSFLNLHNGFGFSSHKILIKSRSEICVDSREIHVWKLYKSNNNW